MTRKILFTAILMLCATLNSKALSPIRLGVKAGITFPNVELGKGDATPYNLSADSKTGFFGGVSLSLPIPLLSLSLQPELTYSANSYTLTDTRVSTTYSSTVRIKTIEIPVMVGIKLWLLRLHAGPVFNLWNQTSVSPSVSNPPGAAAENYSVSMILPSVGYMVGTSINIGRKVNFTARYNGYFNKPLQSIQIGNAPGMDVETKMSAWLLSIGYNF